MTDEIGNFPYYMMFIAQLCKIIAIYMKNGMHTFFVGRCCICGERSLIKLQENVS